jgi:exopolysaccharide biosynthesis polyprenyl glycosylphosphotransferase
MTAHCRAVTLDHRTVTAPSQSSTQRQTSKHPRRTVNLRASQVGLSVVRGIITPFTSNAVIPPIEHNGTAMLNVRAHAVRATARLLALVWLDVVASQTLRALASALHKLPAVARVVTERLDLLVGVGDLGGLRLAAALLMGLVLTGAYGVGDRRRSARHILAGCAVATLLSLWGDLWTSPASAALQIVFNAALLGAAVLSGRLLLDAVVCKVVPAPLPRTVLVGTSEGRQSVSDGDDEAIVNGFTIAGSIDIDEVAALSVEGIRRQLVSARADTLLLCGQLDDETFATVVRAAMMAECSVLATARRLALPGISPKVLWRRGRPFIEMRAVALRWQQLLVKRVLDLVLASVLIVLLSPLMLAVAAALVVGSPGPVVFGQRRLGRYGRSFKCFKFRSMYTDAEQRLQSDPELHAEYVRNGFKLPDGEDPRITPLGRILRRTSIDELPQLWNVLRGEMSLVGPRPIVPAEIRHYRDDGQMLLLLQPGITGLWQVSGRSNLAYPERTNLELEYVEAWTLGRDLRILAATVPAVLQRRGAH